MSETPTYTFLPWSRLGVANSISQADSDNSVHLRATIPIDVTLDTNLVGGGTKSALVHKDVQLYGPGDIIGVDAKAILRTEPQNWITSFESNLLAYAEFHDLDFPWRYTPAKATETRLRPWLTVVVLTEDEFEEHLESGPPLASIKLATGKQASDLFPPADQLWAWAHVHVNCQLSGKSLQHVVDSEPDLVTSRVLCPRRLSANRTYHAFIIPTFESGRLAGLGVELPDGLVATRSAWADGQTEFPYYHRWRFRTGVLGDFEYLVRLLVPRPADKRVGRRDIDVRHPGSTLPSIDTPELGGVLKLGGALQVPFDTLPQPDQDEVTKYDEWATPYPHTFQSALAGLINLADDYAVATATEADPDGDGDPIITPPLYGQWHALTSRLLVNRDETPAAHRTNWVHDLNLDPRWRVAAGLGTRVVQRNQETFVDAAWQQVGDVLAANRQLELMQVAREAGGVLYRKHLAPLDDARHMQITAPVQTRIVADGVTVRYIVENSALPYASLSPAFRAMLRPRGRIARRTDLTAPGMTAQLVEKLANGVLISAPDWGSIEGGVTVSQLAAAVMQVKLGQPPVDAATRSKIAMTLTAGHTPEAVAQLPKSPNFVVRVGKSAPPFLHGPTDSVEATRYKMALSEAYSMIKQPALSPKQPLATGSVSGKVRAALDPEKTVPKRYQATVSLPWRIRAVQKEVFVKAMVYPEFDVPMYKPLADWSSELFLPNINRIPHNSVTLLETNQPFIESYMVGLNHEMARELLWREYPTDQRGSYFRQFWDVTGVYPGDPPPDDLREQLRDIPPLHAWSRSSDLGSHNQREMDGDASQLVLVVRGELLKRYPNTVIFAIKAEWDTDGVGAFDKTKERLVTNLDAAEMDNPPPSKVKTPLFEARVSPDIFFIGFDLTADEARGATDDEQPTADNAGWFFVLQERPGEPRFGIDLPAPPGGEPTNLVNWDSLDWNDVGTQEGKCITLDKTINLAGYDAEEDQDNKPKDEDQAAQWNPQTSAAELAYILYQVPVIVAVHAHRMLPSS